MAYYVYIDGKFVNILGTGGTGTGGVTTTEVQNIVDTSLANISANYASTSALQQAQTTLSASITANKTDIDTLKASITNGKKIVNFIQVTDTAVNEGDIIIYLSKLYVAKEAFTIPANADWVKYSEKFQPADDKTLTVVDYAAGIEIQEGWVVSYVDVDNVAESGLYICKTQINATTDWATDKAKMVAVSASVDFSNYYNKTEVDAKITETQTAVTTQVQGKIADINANIGDLTTLTTTEKTSTAAAINEVNKKIQVVDALPTTQESGVIYFVKATN